MRYLRRYHGSGRTSPDRDDLLNSKRLIFHWEASPKNIICRDIAAGSKYPTKWQYQRVIDGPCRGQYPNMSGQDAARELRKPFGNVVKLQTKVVLVASVVASF